MKPRFWGIRLEYGWLKNEQGKDFKTSDKEAAEFFAQWMNQPIESVRPYEKENRRSQAETEGIA